VSPRRTLLEIKKLQYAYRKQDTQWVIDGVDLQAQRDEFLLICGASGSGKSTLCRTFNGLIPLFYHGKFRGEVCVFGKRTANQSVGELFHQIGMVFQNPEAQLFNRTVMQEIAFGLESLGISREKIKERVIKTVELLGISDILMRNPHDLSGGEQQLTSIAAILALKPKLIVLDEPYANLDPLNVGRVRDALQKIHDRGTGVVVCEHRLPYTVSDVRRMIVLHRGKIVLDGPPDELLNLKLQSYGLESPLPTRVGHGIGMKTALLNVASLVSSLSKTTVPPGFPSDFRSDVLPGLLSDLKQDFPTPVSNNSPPVLEVERISFSIGDRQILRDVGFNLRKGECLAIVGANGAGKTVLLKHLNGLYRPSQGRVLVMGKDARNLKVSQLAAYIGIAFQNPNSQFFKLNVWDEICVGAKALNRYDEDWLKQLVSLFHLEPLVNRAPFRLSGGEKKRVAFAAAMAARPAILALDEPTAGQDWYFRKALGELLATLRDMGQAVILVTHDLSFAEQHAHRWLLMAEGQVIAEGKPWDVMADGKVMHRAHLEPTDAFQIYGALNKRYDNNNNN